MSWRSGSALFFLAGVVTLGGGVPCALADPSTIPTDLTELSLEELQNIPVTSVSKTPEPRGGAAAAIAVITNDDIRRSGATTLPDAIRMAPGVHVGRFDPNGWAMGVRGFSGANSGKLLVLMDGRSIYTPLFSGVFWDAQDAFLADLDRIEVIRGPGGTLWGANAMNGVINIITKNAHDTQGILLEGGGGSEQRDFGGFRYGGRLGDDLYYRIYGKYFDTVGGFDPDGPPTDDWHMGRVGFRADWRTKADEALTLQGDLYAGLSGLETPSASVGFEPLHPNDHTADLDGGNLLGRWTHLFSADSEATVQAYYDRTARGDPAFRDVLDTFDLDVQHRFPLPLAQELTWGANYRLTSDAFRARDVIALSPGRSNDQLVSGFVQDEIWLLERALRFTIGTKLEHNDFTGWEVQPSGRAAWTATPGQTLWAAVSRAVRTPTRIERDVKVDANDPASELTIRSNGTPDLKAEELVAYELGYRQRITRDAFLDVAAFYNDYDRLVTQEISDPVAERDRLVVLFRNGNEMHGSTYGGEVALDWKPAPFWRLVASDSALEEYLRAEPTSKDTVSPISEKASPQNQIQLRSLLDLPHGVELDAWIRWVDNLGDLHEPNSTRAPSYWSLDLRLGWRPTDGVDVSVVGQNLLEAHHLEFPDGTEVPRGVYGKLTWRYATR